MTFFDQKSTFFQILIQDFEPFLDNFLCQSIHAKVHSGSKRSSKKAIFEVFWVLGVFGGVLEAFLRVFNRPEF